MLSEQLEDASLSREAQIPKLCRPSCNPSRPLRKEEGLIESPVCRLPEKNQPRGRPQTPLRSRWRSPIRAEGY